MPEKIHVGIQERWWVLRHLNPQMVEMQLSRLNGQRASNGMEALVYFIPHQFAKEAVYIKDHGKAYNDMVRENNDLRKALHYYLFVKATEADISALVEGEWNRTAPTRLSMCRSKSGEPLWATARDMDQLIALMSKHREMFSLEPTTDRFQVDDRVMLKTKIFEGYEFYVTKVRKKEHGASLTLELPVFNGRFILKASSVDVSRHRLPVKIQQLLSPGYVEKIEQTLTAIASHRYGRRKTKDSRQQAESDSAMLHDLQFLSYMEFDDSKVHNHVKTLMLLHAVLRKDNHAVAHYTPVVQQMLHGSTETMTDEDAFIMAVLYLATHDADYRDAAKHYEQKHKPLAATLTQLIRVIKYVRFRNTAKQKIGKKTEKKATKQIEETMKQISDCDFSSLSPQGAGAVWSILALSPYHTEEGRALQDKLKDAALRSQEEAEKKLRHRLADGQEKAAEREKSAWQKAVQRFSETSDHVTAEVTPDSLIRARSNLLHAVRPGTDALVAYYDMLSTLHPDRNATDSADLYQEYLRILLNAYSKAQQFTTSWWQLKAVLESYYHTNRV